MTLEGSEKINDANDCDMNSIKLLGLCKMLLSQLKETTSHGLRWNKAPVSPSVIFFVFFFLFFCRGLVFLYSMQYDTD